MLARKTHTHSCTLIAYDSLNFEAIKLKMQAKQDMDSAKIPLLADYEHEHEHGDLERAKGSEPIKGTTSFFKTTFNGLNTLLGMFLLAYVITIKLSFLGYY